MSILLTEFRLNKKEFIVAAIPCFPLFTWYYSFSYYLLKFIVIESPETFYTLNATFNFILSLSLVLSPIIIQRINKISAIYAWAVLSAIGTLIIMYAPISALRLAIYLLSGIPFGIGLIAFFTFFYELTVYEERGRVAGLIGSIFIQFYSVFVALSSSLDFFGTALFCIILNVGTLLIALFNPKKITMLRKKKEVREYRTEKKTIILYLIPWAIYSLINATLAKTISFNISQYFSASSLILLVIMQVIGSGLGAIASGVIADFFGRRIPLAFGLTLYGVSLAISGLTKNLQLLSVSYIGTGMAWGIFSTLYIFTIWGELATAETVARKYSIGLAIYYVSVGLGFLLNSQLLQISLIVAVVASCLLVFLSNIPLILVPETSPSDLREKIRYKLYIYSIKRKKLK